MKMNKSVADPSSKQRPTLAADAGMRDLPCARNARNSIRRLSTTESYPNQLPTSQQLIGSKNSLGTFTSRRSLCMPRQQDHKSETASVGGLHCFWWLIVIGERKHTGAVLIRTLAVGNYDTVLGTCGF